MKKVYFMSWIMTIIGIVFWLIIDIILAYTPGLEGGVPLNKYWPSILFQIGVSPLIAVLIMPLAYLTLILFDEEKK